MHVCVFVCLFNVQVENCNQSASCCDGYNPNAVNVTASCTLACSTVARLRPPYINNIALRARMYYPIPTPDPGTSFVGAVSPSLWHARV